MRAVEGCCTPLGVCHPVCLYPPRPPFPRPAPQGTPDGPTLSPPARPVQAVQHRAPPCAGARRRGCRAALGVREYPRRGVAAGGGRYRLRWGALARGRRTNAVCFSYPPKVFSRTELYTRQLCFGRGEATSSRHDRLLLGEQRAKDILSPLPELEALVRRQDHGLQECLGLLTTRFPKSFDGQAPLRR